LNTKRLKSTKRHQYTRPEDRGKETWIVLTAQARGKKNQENPLVGKFSDEGEEQQILPGGDSKKEGPGRKRPPRN